MPESPNIRTALAEHVLARRELLDRYPSLREDDPAFLDTLAGLSDLDEAIGAVVLAAEEDQRLVTAIDSRISELEVRGARLELRAERKLALARDAMEMTGKRKIERPEFTLSLAKSPTAVHVTNRDLIPADLQKPLPSIPDRKAIKAALEAGRDVPGAVLNNPADHLVIRRT